MELDRSGLEVLDRLECLRLLGTARLGRIGASWGALPTILPVAYRLEGEQVVVRTTVGSKLATATPGTVVAFEADELDSVAGTGWSVTLTGVARLVDERSERGGPVHPAGSPWEPGAPCAVIAISTEIISGRRRAEWGADPAG